MTISLSALLLRRCGGVTVLPLAPLDPDSAWGCDKCGLRLAAEDQQQTLCDALEVRENKPMLLLFDIVLIVLDHQQLPQGRSEGGPGGGDDSRAVQAAGAHTLAHDGDPAETDKYLQLRGIQSENIILIIIWLLLLSRRNAAALSK